MDKKISILGTRGIPAKYGGFETFSERLSLYLVAQGWDVTVYCQAEPGKEQSEKYWQGIRLVNIPTPFENAIGSIVFDWKSALLAANRKGIVLTLGYNTAVFSLLYRIKKKYNLINMDGLEWKRRKWKLPEKAWLYLNERAACWLANHLIADHPEINKHLLTRIRTKKITVIPYGADAIDHGDQDLLVPYNITPNQYVLVIARPEPENLILEIVSAFSSKTQGIKMIVLGRYLPDIFPYHKKVLAAASDEVIFPGSIYDKPTVNSLRFYARLYIHGHTVGGTNPSLVEALSAGTPILAQANSFNRWVAGTGAHYFKDKIECEDQLQKLLSNEEELKHMKVASLQRYHENFSDNKDLKVYESLLLSYLSKE